MPKIEMGKNYQTRSRAHVRILCTNRPSAGLLKVVAVSTDGMLITTDLSGTSSNGRQYDLFEIKPRIKRTFWFNQYPDGVPNTSVWDTREKADKWAQEDRIACVKVVIDCEEGEGLA